MKANKMWLAVCLAAMTLASCNKEDHTPSLSGNLKSVQISLGNLTLKSPSDFVADNSKATLNNFKIFLTDGTDIYQAGKASDVTPTYYYEAVSGSTLPTEVSIHLVPSEVTKVVVVGNVGESTWGDELTSYSALLAKTISIDEQADVENLTLFGESDLKSKVSTETHDNNLFNTYTAKVNLAPKVARIEYNGFAILFNSDSKYDKVEVKQVAFDNYYSAVALSPSAVPETLVTRVQSTDDADIFGFFGANAQSSYPLWYSDILPSGDVVLEKAAGNDVAIDDMAQARAYHFFPAADAQPTLYIQLDVYPKGETTPLPSYLYTKSFKNDSDLSGEDTVFKPGYIYRMNFADATGAGDGDIPFKEDDLESFEKCVEISVDVIPWTVVMVYPEF